MKYDVVTIGSATQEVYLFSRKFKVIKNKKMITGQMECFAFGTKIELDDVHFEIGGAAVNTAATFKRQGFRVGCLTRLGRDAAGEEVRRFLVKEKIGDLAVYDPRQRTAHSVFFLTPSGERTILVYRGAAHNFHTQDISASKIKQTRWLYISSMAGKLDVLRRIFSLAKRYKVKIAFNPGKLDLAIGAGRLAPLLKQVDILIMNDEEAGLLTRKPLASERGYLTVLRRWCTGIIAVTRGRTGSSVLLNNTLYRVIIKPIKSVDTTGAGDAFGSGLVAGLQRFQGDVAQAIRLACNNAAGEVKQLGAKRGLISRFDKLNKVAVTIKKFTL